MFNLLIKLLKFVYGDKVRVFEPHAFWEEKFWRKVYYVIELIVYFITAN